jgi:hypothetical protein
MLQCNSDQSWQQFGQLATHTPTAADTAKITTSTTAISHCRRRRKNSGSHHFGPQANGYPSRYG